jgi:hypothetical protein
MTLKELVPELKSYQRKEFRDTLGKVLDAVAKKEESCTVRGLIKFEPKVLPKGEYSAFGQTIKRPSKIVRVTAKVSDSKKVTKKS